MDVTPLGDILALGEGRWWCRRVVRLLKAMCQASKCLPSWSKPQKPQNIQLPMHIISPPCPSPLNMTSSSKRGRFAPPGQIIWQVRAGLCRPSHYQGLRSLIFLIRHAGPWHPTCGLVAPWKPKLGLFSQNCPPNRSCKDKWACPPRISCHNIMISESNQ